MIPNIGLSPGDRESVVALLNLLLADEYVLYTKTRNYHWNVKGPHFHDLHKFFESQYEAIDETIDEVAERARTLGGAASATLVEFTHAARLKEQPGTVPTATQMISNLVADHEAIIRILRVDQEACTAQYHDAGTADFLTALMEEHEKMAWLLRAHLES